MFLSNNSMWRESQSHNGSSIIKIDYNELYRRVKHGVVIFLPIDDQYVYFFTRVMLFVSFVILSYEIRKLLASIHKSAL